MKSITIVGAGRLGCALGLALDASGCEITNLVFRGEQPSDAILQQFSRAPSIVTLADLRLAGPELVFISTQDTEIESVSRELSSRKLALEAVFHTSGSLSSSVLHDLSDKGTPVGSFHPLVSVSDPLIGSSRFSGAYVCIEGDETAAEIGRELATKIGSRPFSIATEKKALYHAAAVTACGHLVALIDIAVEMLSKCDVERSVARSVLTPLIESTVENLARQDTAAALTGSFARGDSEAFERHMAELKKAMGKREIETYLDLGERSIEIMLASGAGNGRFTELAEKVAMAKRELR